MAKNKFSEETQFRFIEDNMWECFYCGANHANCLHHIFGRGKEEGCEKSPLNAAPVNNHYCHLPHHGWLTSDEGKKFLIKKNLALLEKIEYRLDDNDNKFLEKYGSEINRLGLLI